MRKPDPVDQLGGYPDRLAGALAGESEDHVATLLHSRHPMFLWWGEELIHFCNDAYLVKPVDLRLLNECINDCGRNSRFALKAAIDGR